MEGRKYIWFLNGISLMLIHGVLAGHLSQNLALGKNSEQSSTNESAAAGRAVDGNRDSNFTHNSCALTQTESNPWWRVDLQKIYRLNAIILTNRDDGNGTLSGAEIWIGESLKTKDGRSMRFTSFHTCRRCAVVSSVPQGQTSYVPCQSLKGRFVTVLLPGDSIALSLCEVEVYFMDQVYPYPNVALKGRATQSSTLPFAAASKAIDGRRDSYYSQGSCSHTAGREDNPWWRVDLQRTYLVTSVKVTNRGDCCADRLDGAEIRIGNSQENNGNNNPRCAVISHLRAGKTQTYYCDGGWMAGRFVNIIIPGSEKILTLCEVEVYGAKDVKQLPNLALKKQTNQSSAELGRHELSSAGVDGCKDSHFSNTCCTRTETESKPWWSVNLGATYSIVAVTLISSNGSSEMLRGAEVRIGNRGFQDSHRCANITTVQSTPIYTFECTHMTGRRVIVYHPQHNKTLTVCEVEVYGYQKGNEKASSVDVPPSTSPPPPPTTALPPSESVELGGRTATLVGKRLCWSDALLYCRRHHWDLLSLSSKEDQSQVEKLLSVSPFPLTGRVWLGLRRNLYSGHTMRRQWFWMSSASMQFTNWPSNSDPSLYLNSCGAMEGGGRHLWVEQSCEELLNFICESRPADNQARLYFYSSSSSTEVLGSK